MPPLFPAARAVLLDAVRARAFPAAVVEVGTRRGALWREAFGALTYAPDATPAAESTIFDLASLTKVVATTTIALDAVRRGTVGLDDPAARWLPEWRRAGRDAVTVTHLLAHASGLPAWLPLYMSVSGREAVREAIAAVPLEFAPGRAAVYSDLAFITLGFALEQATGVNLDEAWMRLATMLDLQDVRFRPPAEWRRRIAPTERDPWRQRVLVGEVHDENAAALGGVAAHAGLFGAIEPMGRFARLWLALLGGTPGPGPFSDPALGVRFATQSGVAGSSRALGWDTMLPTSSCGTRLSPRAIGHTGFTGTSLWLDPIADLYVVLLTNRVHPTRANDGIRRVRPALHDAVVEDMT